MRHRRNSVKATYCLLSSGSKILHSTPKSEIWKIVVTSYLLQCRYHKFFCTKWSGFFFYRYVKKNNSPTPRDILQPEGKEIQHIKAIEEYPPLMESDGWGDCWEQLPPRDGRLPLFPIVRRKQEHSDGVAHSLIYLAVAYSCYIIDDHPPHIDLSIFRVARPPWPRAFNNRLIYFFFSIVPRLNSWAELEPLLPANVEPSGLHTHLQRRQGHLKFKLLFIKFLFILFNIIHLTL